MPTPSLADRIKQKLRSAITAVKGAPAAQDDAQVTMPVSPFKDWGYEQAEAAVEDAVNDSELDAEKTMREGVTPIPDQVVYEDPRLRVGRLLMNRAFFFGDHWQMGAGWIGPHPQDGDADFTEVMNELVAAFTSKNVIKEVTKRHASGVIGKAPVWSFVPRRVLSEGEEPTTEETAAISRANLMMQSWFEARKARSLLHDAVCTLLYGARAPLRLYIPAGLLADVTTADGTQKPGVTVTSIEQALNLIWPDHPTPEHAAVVQDDDTKLEAGVRIYEAPSEDADSGTSDEDDEGLTDYAEIVYLDQTAMTIIKVIAASEEDEEGEDAAPDTEEYPFDFGGRLTMMEMRRDPLITPQVTQQQRALNLAISMLPRNVITGGFLERVMLNAQMPGHIERDETGKTTGRFVRDDLHVGSGTTNFFVGIKSKGADGKEVYATPDVRWHDPVPVDAPVAAAAEHYRSILDEVSQLHVLLSGEAVLSGKSRDQARKEYVNSLGDTVPEVNAALRFLLETPLAMAEALAGTPGVLTRLIRVEASCRVDTGPLDAAERTAVEASIGKTLSTETAMALCNVEDVDAERARMAADPLSRATLAKAQGDALMSLTSPGVSIETACEWIGLDPKLTAQVKKDIEEGAFETDPTRDPASPGDPALQKDENAAKDLNDSKNKPGTRPASGATSQAGGDT